MCKDFNITAIIYDKRGRVLSIGKNSYIKTHPLQNKYCKEAKLDYHKVFLHAEVAAIVRCRHIEKAYKIVITRFNKKGVPVNCKPCAACQLAIAYAGIKVIEHT
jgi:deoxycytidylate deaminase